MHLYVILLKVFIYTSKLFALLKILYCTLFLLCSYQFSLLHLLLSSVLAIVFQSKNPETIRMPHLVCERHKQENSVNKLV